MLKYCVAEVNTSAGIPEVTFYAFQQGGYGLHRVSDWNDRNVQWYDSKAEAMNNRLCANDCVLPRYFEDVEA